MKLARLVVFLLILFGFNNSIMSQRHYFFTEQWTVGLGVGASSFYGDLTDKTNRFFSNTPFSKYFYQDRQARAIMVIEKKINIYFGVRGHVSYGKLKSTQESTKQYFTANLFEYSLSGVVDFTNIFFGHDRYRASSFYGFVGIGFTESRTWKYNMISGAITGTNGFGSPKVEGGKYIPMTETVIPMGLGYRYQFNKYFSAYVEMELHPIRTDKLDATVSDDSKMEGYGLISVGVSYHMTLPDHWQVGNRYPRYNGKSTDPAIKSYNKRKRVIMQSKGHKKGLKNRKKLKTKRKKGLFR